MTKKPLVIEAEQTIRAILNNPNATIDQQLEAMRNLVKIRRMPKRTRQRRKRSNSGQSGSVLGTK